MRFFLTGLGGFVASNLADELIEQGHEVGGIDDFSTGRLSNVPKDATFVLGDIRDLWDLGPAIKGFRPDVVFHCAASYKDRADWERDASTNVSGTINVVREAIRAEAKLVYFQTSLCYGLNPVSPVTLDAPLNPQGSYAVSKTAGERYIADSGIDYVSLRLANIYGPRNLSGPAPAFYKRLAAGEPCTVVDSRRDFVYIDDLVQVAIKAATQGRGVYHVSSGKDVSIEDIYLCVAEAMDILAPAVEIAPRGPDDAPTLLLDPSETLAEFGWSARTPPVSGIRQAVEFYQRNGVGETYSHLTMKG